MISRRRSYLHVDSASDLPRLETQYQAKTHMKKYITYTILAFFAAIAVSSAAPDKDAIMAKEKAAWQAFKDKNAADFKKVVDKDFRGVYAEGISDMEKELSDMKKWDMKSFALSDFNLVITDANTALVTYQVKVEATVEGKDASGTYNAGSIWQMKNGEWHPIFHTNIKQEAAAK